VKLLRLRACGRANCQEQAATYRPSRNTDQGVTLVGKPMGESPRAKRKRTGTSQCVVCDLSQSTHRAEWCKPERWWSLRDQGEASRKAGGGL